MPQASSEDRDRMLRWFGTIDVYPIEEFLRSRGYVLVPREWYWKKPTPSHTVSEEERHCIVFLVDEWDYDGYEPGPNDKRPD